MQPRIFRALTPDGLEALCLVLRQPRTSTTPWWIPRRNEACARLIADLALRAGETAHYRWVDVVDSQGMIRDKIIRGPLRHHTGDRPGVMWEPITLKTRVALQRWAEAYPRVVHQEPHPDMPLWLSFKHGTVVQGLARESIWRDVKAAGRACGLPWVTTESLRLMNAHLVTPDEKTTAIRVLEILSRAKRHSYLQQALWHLKRPS